MIKANFNTYNTYVTDSLYQWDVNQDLVINGLNLSVVPEIHFANANMDRAIVRQATLESGVVTVRIPNSLLQAALTIKAYVGIYEGDTFKVVETIEIPVIAKAKPADYVFEDTDGEIYSFNKLDNEILSAKQEIADRCDANLVELTGTVDRVVDERVRVLDARLDSIVAQNNDTEGNTELIDIRTGADGTVHASAGAAVRQISADVGDLYANNISVGNVLDGKYVGSINGFLADHANSCATDFVPVDEGFTIRIKNCFLKETRSVCAYDANKVFVECVATGMSDTTEIDYVVPSGVAYVRITGRSGVIPSVAKVNHPINTELNALSVRISSVEEMVEDIVSSDITPYRIETNKFVNQDGIVQIAADSSAYFIKVHGGHTVVISGVNTKYSRAVCIYDTDNNFKECVGTNNNTTEYTISVDEDSLIGCSVTTGVFSARYTDRVTIDSDLLDLDEKLEQHSENDAVGNYIQKERQIDQASMEPGYLSTAVHIAEVDNPKYLHTPYVDLVECQPFSVKNIMPTGGVAVYYYDTDKNCISKDPGDGGGSNVAELTFTSPRGTRYIRFSVRSNVADKVYVTYLNDVPRNAQEKSTLDGWFSDSFGKITTLFGEYVKKPLITIIDDDTTSATHVQVFKDVCDANGIKGTFACVTSQITKQSDLLEKLLEYEKEGFHLCLHCHEHNSQFHPDNFVLSDLERNIVQGCKDMETFGFTDWRYFCTPGGASFEELQNLVRKWGLECLIRSNANRPIETTEAKYGRWGISRPQWKITEITEGEGITNERGNLTLTGWKSYADEVVAKGGWLLINTHMFRSEPTDPDYDASQDWTDTSSATRAAFDEFVTYAKSIGCTFTTLNEAWRIKGQIYKFYELFV